jgi:hypothetical protein
VASRLSHCAALKRLKRHHKLTHPLHIHIMSEQQEPLSLSLSLTITRVHFNFFLRACGIGCGAATLSPKCSASSRASTSAVPTRGLRNPITLAPGPVSRTLTLHTTGPKMRSRFGRKSETFVQEWPSTGGILIADDCSAVELEFLGLERFRETHDRARGISRRRMSFVRG